MVKINGKNLDADGKSIAQYLETANFDTRRIVVECNGEIVPKAQYSETILKDGDCVEIVSFVGGG